MRKKHASPMPVGVALFFIIVGLLLGTVFTAVMHYEQGRIEREDAVTVSAVYDSYQLHYQKNSIALVELRFLDRESLYIDGACADGELLAALEALPKGSSCEMLLHPRSDDVWELKHGAKTLLAFEQAQKALQLENVGFTMLGIFAYFWAVAGALSLLKRWIKARKISRNKRVF